MTDQGILQQTGGQRLLQSIDAPASGLREVTDKEVFDIIWTRPANPPPRDPLEELGCLVLKDRATRMCYTELEPGLHSKAVRVQ